MASPASPIQYKKYPVETLQVNSLGTKQALDFALQQKALVVYASTSEVYGDPLVHPQVEWYWGNVNPNGVRSCYDEGKRFAETITKTYADAYNLDAKIARIFRTYGPRMRLNTGQMLPDFVSSALKGKELVIYGDENFSSSLCHVSDMVQGLMKMMKSGEAGPMNFGSDLDVKLADVAKKVIALTGSTSSITYKEPLLFMTPLGLPDITHAKERLGWFPVVLLDDGIQSAIDYFKAHKSIVKPLSRWTK